MGNMMKEQFAFLREKAKQAEEAIEQENIIDDHEMAINELLMSVVNMSSILIAFMQSMQKGNAQRHPREIVEEQAKHLDFIDLDVWQAFFKIRNLWMHKPEGDMKVPVEALVQKIIPEFVKEFEMLCELDAG